MTYVLIALLLLSALIIFVLARNVSTLEKMLNDTSVDNHSLRNDIYSVISLVETMVEGLEMNNKQAKCRDAILNIQ